MGFFSPSLLFFFMQNWYWKRMSCLYYVYSGLEAGSGIIALSYSGRRVIRKSPENAWWTGSPPSTPLLFSSFMPVYGNGTTLGIGWLIGWSIEGIPEKLAHTVKGWREHLCALGRWSATVGFCALVKIVLALFPLLRVAFKMHLPLDLERKELGTWKPTVIYLKNQFNKKLALANLQAANLYSLRDGESSFLFFFSVRSAFCRILPS